MKKTLLFAGFSVGIAVMLGAMGAHYLRETLEFPPQKIASWKTAVEYHMLHGIALIAFVALEKNIKTLNLSLSRRFLLVGMTLFSVSIYLLTLNHLWQISWLGKLMGPLTPIGGLCMIAGWIIFVLTVRKIQVK